jgi:hypothetical protein
MKMTLGSFLGFVIRADGRELAALLSLALAHYREALKRDEPSLELPTFLPDPPHSHEVDVALAPALESMLLREAARREVAVGRVLSHAVFLYLADQDRLAGLMEGR